MAGDVYVRLGLGGTLEAAQPGSVVSLALGCVLDAQTYTATIEAPLGLGAGLRGQFFDGSVDVAFGLGATLDLLVPQTAELSCGLGLGCALEGQTLRAATLSCGIGLGAALSGVKHDGNDIVCGIGLGAALAGEVTRAASLTGLFGLSCVLSVSGLAVSGGPAAIDGIPDYGSQRWC